MSEIDWHKPHVRKELGCWLVTEHRYVLAPAFVSKYFEDAAEVARWLSSPPAWQAERPRSHDGTARDHQSA